VEFAAAQIDCGDKGIKFYELEQKYYRADLFPAIIAF
ncbi:MAG: hypothetical protein H6Q94_1086, partial [Nitrospirae bacterium]|nr:hypothetical protein [Nitrospirota bacterium]